MPICFGAGLIALDVILNGSPSTLPKLSTGGSCGNVLSILSFLKWKSYPIGRLSNSVATEQLLSDLKMWNVDTDFLTKRDNGSTPIIIHRILKDKNQQPVHRFEFKDPDTKKWLPQFKAVTKKEAAEIINSEIIPDVFYIDRINPGTLDMASYFKSQGTIIFFEPSSIKEPKLFSKILEITDILKFSSERLPEYKLQFNSIQCYLEVETKGKQGLAYRTQKSKTPDQWKSIKSFSIDKVQDAAGAGDWCSAGIIKILCGKRNSSLFENSSSEIREALCFGQALGALNCMFDGARGLMYNMSLKSVIKLANQLTVNKNICFADIKTLSEIDITTSIPFSKLYGGSIK